LWHITYIAPLSCLLGLKWIDFIILLLSSIRIWLWIIYLPVLEVIPSPSPKQYIISKHAHPSSMFSHSAVMCYTVHVHSMHYSGILLYYIFIYFACFASTHIMGLDKNYFLLSNWFLFSLLYHVKPLYFYYVWVPSSCHHLFNCFINPYCISYPLNTL
jgi:hypothetical protein